MRHEDERPAPYWNSYVAGIGLGLVLLASFVVMGRGLGASGAATRFASYAVHKVDASLGGGTRAEADSIARRNSYMAEYLPREGDPFDDFLVYMFLGVLVGGFVAGLGGGRVRFETIRGPQTSDRRRLVLAVLGGIVSAYGARLARGCTSGQALTGGATLALGSWAFMLAVFAGGYALAWFMRKEWL
ncbi:MAG: hypothetical protein FJ125_05370 [Deltaproteobacteria bacterium]|nr:hypothetical protein [Deltaproteobacteria bacterium]